jgi:hypothetical protein
MTDPVVGGPPDVTKGEGIANIQAQQLAKRTAFLKVITDALGDASGYGVSTNADLNVDGALLTTRASIRLAIAAAIDALVDGAPGALDTLNELSVALGNSDDAVAALTSSIATKLNSSTYTAADVLAKLITVGIATQFEAEAGVVSNKIMTPLRVAQAVSAAVGVGQTWQDKSASRRSDLTVYQNPEAVDITVNILYGGDFNSAYFQVSADSSTWITIWADSGDGGPVPMTGVPISPLWYYRSSTSGGTNDPDWFEFRSPT